MGNFFPSPAREARGGEGRRRRRRGADPSRRNSDSNLKQPSVIARILSPAPSAPVSSCPSKHEGAERREAHRNQSTPFGATRVADKLAQSAQAKVQNTRAPRGAPQRRVRTLGPCFRVRTGGFAPPDPGGFRRRSSGPRPAIEGSPT